MTSAQASTDADNYQQQANQYLLEGDYTQTAYLYEQAIAAEPEVKSHYWHLGLMLLLQRQEAEAQMTWMLGMAEGEPEQIEWWTNELIQVLQIEAERQEALGDYQLAWAIRQHMQEIAPTDVNNLLHSIALSIQLETFTGENLTASGIIELLRAEELAVDSNLLLLVLQNVLNYSPEHPNVLTFTEACLHHAHKPQAFIDVVMFVSKKIAYSAPKQPALASRFAELCLRRDPNNIEVLKNLAFFYQDSHQYFKGIDTGKRCYELAKSLIDKIHANHIIIRALVSASGCGYEACAAISRQQELMLILINQGQEKIDKACSNHLFNSNFFFSYLKDAPRNNRFLQNQISRICQENFENYAKHLVDQYRHKSLSNSTKDVNKTLKIGYISHCLRKHSVGWIARWLFQYHNQKSFQIYAYLINYLSIDEFVQQWFVNNTYRTYRFETPSAEILKQLCQDELDILVDLDSLTFPSQCEILSTKTAPIQVTWLGWDASGLPSVDYFIADSYVLPDSAQDYYTEKIWRLPNTYVAVDGFEVGVPNLRRDQLDIPGDAVIYLVTQNGYKRHLDNVRLQMRILTEVPNSYLLVKGLADEESSRTFFEKVAEEEGAACDHLRFLPRVVSEEVHRANLGIADVVLDTYPYNGATTTLETLWMGIPLVTRVGQQFAARNSYTMMMNVGITQGIAWTDEEYIEWGVRLGKDPALRQQIAWQLRQSRQSAPLWNARQFTREMEKAYEQMWARYVEAGR